LTRFWRRRGPLQPGQEGVLVRDAHDYQPYYVQASNGRRWWYFQNEITPCHEAEREHHRRPNAHHRPTVGSRVCLTRFWRMQGPLKPGQEGVLVRDAHDYQPYYVRASNGRRWWYFQNEIMPCHEVERQNVWQHEIVRHRRTSHRNHPTVGSRVCLTRFWRGRGPLRPGQEGVLVTDTHDYLPYYVRASDGRKWWYFQNEIMPCHGVERRNVRQHEVRRW